MLDAHGLGEAAASALVELTGERILKSENWDASAGRPILEADQQQQKGAEYGGGIEPEAGAGLFSQTGGETGSGVSHANTFLRVDLRLNQARTAFCQLPISGQFLGLCTRAEGTLEPGIWMQF